MFHFFLLPAKNDKLSLIPIDTELQPFPSLEEALQAFTVQP